MHRFLIFILGMGLSSPGTAKDLTDRFGAGMGIHDFNTTPTLSLRYVPERGGVTATAQLGFDTSSTTGATVIGLRVQQNAASERNLNFFFGLGAYLLLNRSAAGSTVAGGELDVLMGVEFFLPDLPNLGIELHTGLAYRSLQGTVFRTIGNGFLGSAFHYYF